MKNKVLLIALASFLGWSISHASVTNIVAWSYSGGIYCYQPVLSTDGSGDQSVSLDGYQWTDWGTMGLTIQTSSASDPTLTIENSIDNESPFAWTEYIVNVAMSQSFSISNAVVNLPSGWSENVTQPILQGGNYVGTIDYFVTGGGTPVAIYPGANSTLDYSYQITFSGSTSYSFTESAMAVPEPSGLGFLMAGGLLVGGMAIVKRRQAKLLVKA
jgi:hypothetical protein